MNNQYYVIVLPNGKILSKFCDGVKNVTYDIHQTDIVELIYFCGFKTMKEIYDFGVNSNYSLYSFKKINLSVKTQDI